MTPRPSIQDIVVAIFFALRILFLDLPLFLFTKIYHDVSGQSQRLYHGLPLRKLIEALLIRNTSTYLPNPITRYLSDIGLPGNLLKSRRYAPYAPHLYQQATTTDFKGTWIVRGGFTDTSAKGTSSSANIGNGSPRLDMPHDPATSDIVIYFLHGGGYVTNSPATYTLFLLRLAEIMTRAGKTVSIFALDYDLAPEVVFPGQLVQAKKAYEWLIVGKHVGGMGIDRRKILLMGDSAGGHLCLSLLVDLWRPLTFTTETREPRDRVTRNLNDLRKGGKSSSGTETVDLRPGLGMILMSPWLSLYHRPDSFTRNACTDLLTARFLSDVANAFLGPKCQGRIPREYLPWLEFLDDNSGIVWDEVLPGWNWVSAGRFEIFYDDVVRWVREREGDCTEGSGAGMRKGDGRGERIVGELDQDEVHDYAWLKTMDQRVVWRFCGTRMGEEEEKWIGIFDGVERIGRGILGRWSVVFAGDEVGT